MKQVYALLFNIFFFCLIVQDFNIYAQQSISGTPAKLTPLKLISIGEDSPTLESQNIFPQTSSTQPAINGSYAGPPSSNLESQSNVDPNWYLQNPEIPDALRVVLSENQNILTEMAYQAHQNCTVLQENGLLDFFSNDIMNLVRTKPSICEAFEATEEIRTSSYFDFSSTETDQNNSTNRRTVQISYTTYKFNSNLLAQDEDGLPAYEKLLLAGLRKERSEDQPYSQSNLSIPKPFSDQPAIQDLPEENFTYMIETPLKEFKSPHPLLLQTMLMRLWDKLSPLHQMQSLQACPDSNALNSNSLTWQLNNEEQRGSDQYFTLFKKICHAKSIQELLPYIDESVMTEFALYSSQAEDPAAVLLPICINWPSAQVVTPSPLPPVTRDQVIYRSTELSDLTSYRYQQFRALRLLNQRSNSSLTPDQETALNDYTSSGDYNRINAYEIWGRLGVWLLPSTETYTDDPMRTQSDVHLSETSLHLREALQNLDGFDGVTFGGHQLSGKLLKGLTMREGSSFSPGFFMSTSTSQSIAINFLGINPSYRTIRDEEEQRPQDIEEPSTNQDVTGYLFVVRNRNGVPITNFSTNSHENEILLHPDTEYKILSIETLTYEGETYPNAQVVFIEEIIK